MLTVILGNPSVPTTRFDDRRVTATKYGSRAPIKSSCRSRSWTVTSIVALFPAIWLLAILAVPARALGLPTSEPESSITEATIGGGPAGSAIPGDTASGVDSDDAETPTSIEIGHTQMSGSFEHRPIAGLLQESSLVGIRDTSFAVQFRSYYLDQDNFNHSQSEAWTAGGLAGFKTGYFENIFAFGATGYTSQPVNAPASTPGAPILAPGQTAYTVMGELYGEFKITDEILATVGRRGFDTPFINTQDGLMTPYTFQVYGVQGEIGSADDRKINFGAAYVDKIKERTSEEFESMATAMGAPAGVDRGVYVAGANLKAGRLSVGATEYYSADIINIAYTEITYTIPLVDRMRLSLNAQYTDQRSVGQNLLTGYSFAGDQYGLKADLAIGPALLTVARSGTAIGSINNSSFTSLRNPWGGYPGYTGLLVENFYRAGENATMLRAAYNFPRVTGLSMYAAWVHGSTPSVINQYAQQEYDGYVQWSARSGALKGLKLVSRYAHVSQQGPANQHLDEVRFILYYEWR